MSVRALLHFSPDSDPPVVYQPIFVEVFPEIYLQYALNLFEGLTNQELCLEFETNATCQNCPTPALQVWLIETSSRVIIVSNSPTLNAHIVSLWDLASHQWLQSFVFLPSQLVNCSVLPHSWPLGGPVVNPADDSPCPPPVLVPVSPSPSPVIAPAVPEPLAHPSAPEPSGTPPTIIVPAQPDAPQFQAPPSTNGSQMVPSDKGAHSHNWAYAFFALLTIPLVAVLVALTIYNGWCGVGARAGADELSSAEEAVVHNSAIYKSSTRSGENPLYVGKRD